MINQMRGNQDQPETQIQSQNKTTENDQITQARPAAQKSTLATSKNNSAAETDSEHTEQTCSSND